jgi:chemotaxis protein methyltransferase CheR
VSGGILADDVERFGRLVGQRLGLRLVDRPGSPLSQVVGGRAARRGVSVEGYLDWLEAGAPESPGNQFRQDEFRQIAAELTVPETYFFRDGDQLRAFAEVAFPERVAARGGAGAVRILSAGCASGEEPYTLAMLSLAATSASAGMPSILGVDVNPAVLRVAEGGRYSPWSLRAVSPEVRRRWFHADGRDFVLHDEIRRSVRFERRNLAADDGELWRPGGYDIIFCRNVLMYFTERGARALVARLVDALATGGFLFLAHVEPLYGDHPALRLRRSHGSFFYERVDPAASPPRRRRRQAHVPAGREGGTVPSAQAGAGDRQPGSVSVAVGPVLALLRREWFTDALEAIQGLPVAARQDPAVRLTEAVLRAVCTDFGAAERMCRSLLEVAPVSAAAHYALAGCRHGLGDRDSAVFYSRRAVSLDRGFAMPRLYLGMLAAASGDRATARRELAQARRLLPQEKEINLLLFGGGFSRSGLLGLCEAQLRTCGGARFGPTGSGGGSA